jgi:hypothetical protein
VGQVIGLQGIFQRLGHVLLPHHFVETNGTVLAGRDDEITHTIDSDFWSTAKIGKGNKKLAGPERWFRLKA